MMVAFGELYQGSVLRFKERVDRTMALREIRDINQRNA